MKNKKAQLEIGTAIVIIIIILISLLSISIVIFRKYQYGCIFGENIDYNYPELKDISCSKLKQYIDYKINYEAVKKIDLICNNKIPNNPIDLKMYYPLNQLKIEYINRCIDNYSD